MNFNVSINEEKRTIEVKLPSGAKGKAKCMHTDHFSYDVGITLALERARVAEKTLSKPENAIPVKKTATRPFKIGERVRFKSWQQMCQEFYVDREGDIVLPNEEYFLAEMKALCGTYATIVNIYSGYVDFDKMSAGHNWVSAYDYCLDMIEHIK